MLNIFVLPIEFIHGPVQLIIYPVVLQDEKDVVLVDCGYPGDLEKIENELLKHGISGTQVTKIILTHHDHDHMGAASEWTEKYPSTKVLCSGEQAPYVTGKQKSLRLVQAENRQESLPESEKQAGLEFMRFITSIKPVQTVTSLQPGEVLSFCEGVEVVDTKGHMPGHISLYVEKEKTLVAGDALVVADGKLCIAMPQFVLNQEDAIQSVKNILSYDIDTVICYHGGVFAGDVKKCLQQIIRENSRSTNNYGF